MLVTGETPPDDGARSVRSLLKHAFDADLDGVLYGDRQRPSLVDAIRKARTGRPNETLEAVLRRQETRDLVRALRGDLRDVLHVLPFLVPVVDAGLCAATEKDPGFPVVIGSYRDVAALQVDGVSWRDPIQGSLGDCYLIAAMSALAWSRPQRWRERLAQAVRDGAAVGQLRFNLFRNSVSRYPPFDMPGRVPVGLHGQPVYARARRRDESWPALVERAFVMQRCRLRGVDPTEKHYDLIGSDEHLACDPEVAARMLLGGTSRRENKIGAGDSMFAIVSALCPDGVPTFPTIACSEEAGDEPGPAGRRRWRAAGLLWNHAYTVLGIVERARRAYVVLRNPFGLNPARDAHASGRWQPAAGPPGDNAVRFAQDGVVAVPRPQFNAFFRRIGWVELPPDPPPGG